MLGTGAAAASVQTKLTRRFFFGVQSENYDKVIETKKLFSLRYFPLFSLFGSIWKHLEVDCFRYFGLF
jgi:hypothetical protein